MLALLGFVTIAVVLILIMTKRASTIVALMVVPIVTALIGGAGGKVGTFIVNGVKTISPTAAMFIFAVLFFGILSDAGMFDPVIKGILKTVGRDPLKITIASAILAMLVHLDGSGVVTFSIAVPAMLPLFKELKMDPRVLAAVVALGAGTMNMVPWGGPTIRAASALNAPITEVYNPMVISQIAGIVAVLVIAFFLGRREKNRLGQISEGAAAIAMEQTLTEEEQKLRRPKLFWFNVIVTIASIFVMVKGWQTPTTVFMVAFAITLIANYPNPKDQTARINAHAKSALLMASVLFAAGTFTGIMKDSGMLTAMATAAASVVPASLGAHFPLIIGVLAMPLSLLFDPDSFYFGVMPVLAATASNFGVASVDVARAAITGQMTVGFPISPLTPATLLLVGLAGIELGDHQKFTFKWAWIVSLVMLAVAVLTGAIPF